MTGQATDSPDHDIDDQEDTMTMLMRSTALVLLVVTAASLGGCSGMGRSGAGPVAMLEKADTP
jgi:hypothetical protein